MLGAIIGDLLIGNKKSMLFGGILQAVGTFVFCIPSTTGLYTGMLLVVLGNGLYNPNIIANFGKLYLNKTKLLDAGFMTYYLAINIGAFIGVLFIGLIGEKYGWSNGFLVAGVIMLLATIPVLFFKEQELKIIEETTKMTLSKRIIKVVIAFVVIGLFWASFELNSLASFDLQDKIKEISTFDFPIALYSSLNFIFIIIFGILAIILWSFFYKNQFFKIVAGSIFGLLSFGVLLLVSIVSSEYYVVLFILSFLFMSIAEIHIAAIVYSIITQYADPKYLAIVMSLIFIPIGLISYLLGLFTDGLLENTVIILFVGGLIMAFLIVGLYLFNRSDKKSIS
ncbi:MAG: MFS transporter [Fluviicola sp.]|nr:MFS transporter [Fluviicola sp.]